MTSNFLIFFSFIVNQIVHPISLPGDLSNPNYLKESYEKQSQKLVPIITNILSPTLGYPSILYSGEKFVIWTKQKPIQIELIPNEKCIKNIIIKTFISKKQNQLYRTIAVLPKTAPRASYDVKVAWENGTYSINPISLRCLGNKTNKPLKIILIADHQLWDPSWKLTHGLKAPAGFPKHGKNKKNEAINLQEFEEIKLLDPDFVVHLGDLLFGLEYDEEYEQAFNIWSQSPVSTFFIPGNHDAYATYSISLPPISEIALGLIKCKKYIPSEWKKAEWNNIWNFISCVYSDIKNKIFDNLKDDGLVRWKHSLGPINNAFTKNKFRFIFLNTYGGTNKRRHSFSIYIKAFGYHLGAPAVDNYGGYLSIKTLSWIKKELIYAQNHKLTPVIFAHQDPRGNLKGTRYHKNDPFPTEPIGADHFEEWNYDDDWDSNPKDKRYKESTTNNSATKLLKILAKFGGYYISGHIHKDGEWFYNKGDEIIPGIKARKKIIFIKVTSAASSIKDNGYWGYRIIKALPNGTMDISPFETNEYSVPAGNFWIKKVSSQKNQRFVLASSLPKPLDLTFSLCLPVNHYGYFLQTSDKNKILANNVFFIDDNIKYTYKLTTPTTKKRFSSYIKQTFELKTPLKNKAPIIKVLADNKFLDNTIKKLECPQVMDASQSTDPNKDLLFDPYWILENQRINGYKIKLSNVTSPTKLTFRIRDAYGLRSEKTWILTKRSKKIQKPGGCACSESSKHNSKIIFIFMTIFFTFVLLKKKFYTSNK